MNVLKVIGRKRFEVPLHDVCADCRPVARADVKAYDFMPTRLGDIRQAARPTEKFEDPHPLCCRRFAN